MQLSQWNRDAAQASKSSSRITQPRQANALSRKVHLIALDLNGHGKTPDRQAPDVTRSYLEDIDTIMRSYDKPFLMGHSMGGALAQLYALENPEKLSGLVLVGTGARLRVAPIIFDFLDKDPDAYFDAIPKFMFHESTPRIIVETSQAQARECPVQIIRRDFEVCNSFDVMQDVSRISLPALIAVGDSDVMTPLKHASYLHEKIAGSDLRIIPQAGHAAMLEKPSDFNQAVLDWLKL
jgi:pimeloyl-ACP methyl ester carboxylesterase